MARITVEDCLENIDNQFDLVLVAAKRARQIANGADPLVDLENDKPTVVALREIAAGLVNEEILNSMARPVDDILSSEDAEELLASTPLPSLDAPVERLLSAAPKATPPAAAAAEEIFAAPAEPDPLDALPDVEPEPAEPRGDDEAPAPESGLPADPETPPDEPV